MFVGALEFDILLGDVHSLKEKRSVIRPILAELQRFGVSAVEGGDHDQHRRSQLGVALVSSEMDISQRCWTSVNATWRPVRSYSCWQYAAASSDPKTE